MIEDRNFQKVIIPEINAAVLGISNQRWDSVKTTDSLEHAISIMRNNNYDILPITNKKGETKEFYRTKKWGNYDKDNIEKQQINQAETIYYLTDIKDLLHKFVLDKRDYYFLTNYKEIVGLISIVNLNSKATYLYLYNFLIELETELGTWISNLFKDDEIFDILCKKPSFDSQYDNFEKGKRLGINNRLIEYIYLSDMFDLIKEKNKFNMLGYKENEFSEIAGLICKKRNLVCHPINSTTKYIAKDLLEFLTKMEELQLRISEAQLITAYHKTNFNVYEPKLTIKINEKNHELDSILKKENATEWAYITAYNPMSNSRTEQENIIANESLFNDIKDFKTFKGEGIGEDLRWKPEESFLIIGISENKARELGRKYVQKAIVSGTLGQTAKLLIL